MKLSDLSIQEWYDRLNTRRMVQYQRALQWWQYMDNEQPLVYVARILAEQGDRFPPMMINWSELVIGSVDDRMVMEAFLQAGQDKDGTPTESPVEELAEWWQTNDLDEYSSEGHVAAMVSGQAFLMTGPGDDDIPLTTIEYEDEVAVEMDPRTRQPIAGLKVWRDDGTLGGDVMGALYLPGGKAYEFVNGKQQDEITLGPWTDVLEGDPRMPSVPFVPLLTTPRKGMGRSDLKTLKPLVDGANQFATNLMAAGEHHAVPRKWAINLSEKDFRDENDQPIPLWKIATGDVWAVPPLERDGRFVPGAPEPKLGQFAASDLRNFHESVKMIATIAGSLYGLPPGYMGYSSDNPPSAESILYSLERLVLRAGKRQLWFGGAHERNARIAWAIMERDPKELRRLESKWRNPATPTLASMMDAAVKGVQSGIIDDEQAWIDLGYSEQTKKGLRTRKAAIGGQTAANLRATDQLPPTPTTLPQLNGAPVLGV